MRSILFLNLEKKLCIRLTLEPNKIFRRNFGKWWGLWILRVRKKAKVKIFCLVDMTIFLNIKFYENGTLLYLLFWTRRVIPVSKIDRRYMVQWRFYYLLLFSLLLYSFIVMSWYISFLFRFLFLCSIPQSFHFRYQVWQNIQEKQWFAGRNY